MKAKSILIVSVVALASLVICLSIGFAINTSKMQSNANALNSVYERTFYELVDDVNNIEVELSKLSVTEDGIAQQKSLTKLIEKTTSAMNNIAMLPVANNTLNNTSRFINQLNGMCVSMQQYDMSTLSSESRNQLDELYEYIIKIKNELNVLSRNIENGYRIIDGLEDQGQNNFNNNFNNINNDSVEYPTLIYDGPFSDSVLNQEIKGLPESECTQQEAEQYLKNIFSSQGITSVKYLTTTNGKFETFDFSVKLNSGLEYYAQVTKRGMFLLTLSALAETGDSNITVDKGEEIALDMAKIVGLNDMKVAWSASSNGIIYVNLVFTKDNVAIYPDMVKVKVDEVSTKVVGWEASAYAYNHTDRTIPSATLGATEAKNKVSSKLEILSQRLVIIPQDYLKEALAYEFEATYQGYTYYVYIDAKTGEQLKILRVIQTDNGDLLL